VLRIKLSAGRQFSSPKSPTSCSCKTLDESIPLTTDEFDEWGNPQNKEAYFYMKSYSPYENIERKSYPNLLVKTGLHDSQVQYFEPAKWVAKLRVL
jgi:oligopeptidase B